jgi:hypothetical protein
VTDTIKINRAPVLTLWAAVVAERLGFDLDEALTLGRAVAGLTAHAKAVRLGIVEPTPAAVKELRKKAKSADEFQIALLGRGVPAVQTPDGVRAVSKGKPDDPKSIERYLTKAFGGALKDVTTAMTELARSMPPDVLSRSAFRLYEQFRPSVPAGTAGWGAKGTLDLRKIAALPSG